MSGEQQAEDRLGDLGAIYRRTMSPGSSACPGDETLAALAVGELAGEERERVVDHLVGCRRCVESYQTLRELHREASQSKPIAAPMTPGRGRWARSALAVAALALAALGLSYWVGVVPISEPSDLAMQLRNSVAIEREITPVDGAIGPAPLFLAWPPQVGATGYRVVLFDAAAESIWESDVSSEVRLSLPEAVVSALRAGESYFWVVRTRGLAERSELGPFWFEVSG